VTTVFDLASTMRTEAMEAAAIEIDTLDHATTARRLARELGMTVDELGLDGLFAAEERVTVGTHFGTHLDAPTHYGETIDGRPAEPVDRVPLDPLWCDAVVLDFRGLGPLEPITAEALRSALAAAGATAIPGQMLITRIGIEDDYETDPGIRRRGAGLDGSAISWLLEQGVRLSATDSMTQDLPIPWMEERFKAGSTEDYFPVHLAGKRTAYVHVEKANGLRGLPTGSGPHRVAAFPIRVEGASGAWTRFRAFTDLPFDPAAVRVVDLSQPIRNESMETERAMIATHGAARRQRQWAKHLGVRVDAVEPRGAWDQVTATTRAGTHVSTPWRFGPECDGRPAMTVPDLPLEWCTGRAVILDVSDGRPEIAIDRTEVRRALATAGHTIRGGDIVILRTGAEAHFDGDPGYPSSGRGIAVDALEDLVSQGVRVIGTDAETLDRPLPAMLADARAGDRAALYPVHRAARRIEHIQVAKLGGLGSVPRDVDLVVDLAPIKVEGAGSGWCRAVALIPTAALADDDRREA
jgi:kynurenine formamidase